MRKRLAIILVLLILSIAILAYGEEIIIADSNIKTITFIEFKNWLKIKGLPEYVLYDYKKSEELLNRMLEELILLKETQRTTNLKDINNPYIRDEIKKSVIQSFVPNITEKDIQKYYIQHRRLFYRKPQYRLCHILVEDDKKLKMLVESFKVLLAETGSSYEAMISLMNNLSQNDSTSKHWGDLGWISKEKLPKQFAQKVFSQKNCREYITFSSPLGKHFVMVMHIRKPESYSCDTVENYIRSKLINECKAQLWNDFIHKLYQKYNIKIYPQNLRSALRKNKLKTMVFFSGGDFFAGFDKKEINARYKLWKDSIAPYTNQKEPGWISYIYQTYHKAKVDSFYIDRYEATYREYKEFLEATQNRPLPEWIEKFIPGDDYPVVGITWLEANEYCRWRGKKLPTQDEWEFAARGKERRTYPWGNEQPDGKRGNFADVNASVTWKNASYNDGYKYLAPVGSYPEGATPAGVYDMGGNAKEWTVTVDKQKKSAVTKGGSFENALDDMQAADQRLYALDKRDPTAGFRCACNLKNE